MPLEEWRWSSAAKKARISMRYCTSLRIETTCTNLITCAQFGDAKIAESTVVKIERDTRRNNHNAHAALVGKNVEEEALAARGKGLSSRELLGCDNWGEHLR